MALHATRRRKGGSAEQGRRCIRTDALTRARAAATLSSRGSEMGEPAVRTRKWTRLEYERLAEAEIRAR